MYRTVAQRMTGWISLLLLAGSVVISAVTANAQIVHKKRTKNPKAAVEQSSAEPDKILYSRALADIKKGRHEVGRLNLQTLINTYPDSEFLADAKLSIADSYFKEGGTANLAQAISGYKDYIVFFPFLPKAPYAQLQVATCHYKQMEKPDRDRSHAREAEAEFQVFLNKYPGDALAPKAEQRLREVQELLAEGDFRIGNFYYLKGDKRAAAARLIAVTKRYPLYSRSDKALWMLGQIFETSEHKDIAAGFYGRIVRSYPLSPMAPGAKDKLHAFNVPVPQPDPKALAWMQAELSAPRRKSSIVMRPLQVVRSGPENEFRAAARNGAPNLEPDVDTTSATDVLSGGGKATLGSGGGPGNAAVIETVTPGGAASAAGATDGAAAPADGAGANPPSTDPSTPAADAAGTTATPAEAKGEGAAAPAAEGAATSADSAKAGATADAATATTDAKPDDKAQNGKKESSSKKKKGLKKIIPW